MPHIRIREAAQYLAVSDDTVRRWIDEGTLSSRRSPGGVLEVDGVDLARLAQQRAVTPEDPAGNSSSARNRFVGLVTKVTADTVMAQVELQCGPHRVVSLMSAEAARDLGIEPGAVAVAVVKATTVIIETPPGRQP